MTFGNKVPSLHRVKGRPSYLPKRLSEMRPPGTGSGWMSLGLLSEWDSLLYDPCRINPSCLLTKTRHLGIKFPVEVRRRRRPEWVKRRFDSTQVGNASEEGGRKGSVLAVVSRKEPIPVGGRWTLRLLNPTPSPMSLTHVPHSSLVFVHGDGGTIVAVTEDRPGTVRGCV